MTTLAMKAIAGLVGLLVLAVVALWVIGWGPFQSPALKVQAKAEKALAKVSAGEAAAVGKVETTAKAANLKTDERTQIHVANIRGATRNATPADVPDGQFLRGVCASPLYAGNSGCVRYSGESEGSDSAPRPGAVRGR
ncbi:MAG: hypothetical protein ACREE0_14005 [Phenylobacterium sp.]